MPTSDSISHPVSKKGSTIETASGTLLVQPYRPSKDSSQLLAKLTFVPRTSPLESSGKDPFRGFYVLFWISIFLFALRTYVTSFEETGSPLSLSFAELFSKDAVSLALSDAVLVCSTGLAVPFVKLIKNGWIRYMWTGIIIQHLYQALMLGIAIQWTFNQQWEWVQSGFFTLHCLVMMMKVHSYIAINGNFAETNIRQRGMMHKLKELVDALPGGWEQAEKDAANGRLQKARQNLVADGLLNVPNITEDTIPAGTPGSVIEGGSTTPQLTASTLRNRLAAHQASVEGSQVTTVNVANITPSATPPRSEERDSLYFPSSSSSGFPPKTTSNDSGSRSASRHPLLGHPDEDINGLAEIINDLEEQLTSPGLGPKGKGKIRFPQNVTLANFVDYQIIPTLVYELEYPRTNRIRPFYVFEKTVAFLGTFTLLYTTAEHYIIPLTPQPGQNFFRSLLDLALPFMLSYLLLFYIIFECICNGFAELSQFADRQFYEDWWNATSWDEFARKWNKPVHSFLLRHVYASTISHHKLSKPSAALLTFLLSALVHELVMAVVTKKLRMYLFVMQMAQVPLIALGRIPAIRRNKILGNVVFWVGLMTGFPLLCVAYCAY